jgi:hypothetical protein
MVFVVGNLVELVYILKPHISHLEIQRNCLDERRTFRKQDFVNHKKYH